ncbi:MAG: ABC transporter substrate-binding protein, partial [Ignisphaera sp.]
MKKLVELIIIVLMFALSLLPVLQAQYRPEDTLKFSRGRTAFNWNEYAGSTVSPLNILYPTLFIEGESYGVKGFVPILAEKYEWIDPYTVRIYIRSQAKWSDGKPITADDLIYTIRLGLYAGRGPGSGCRPDVVELIKRIDDRTVELRMNKTSYQLGRVGYISFIDCWITLRVYPKHVFEAVNASGQVKSWRNNEPDKMVVSGPYRLVSFDEAAGQIYYERIDNWWGRDIFGLPGPKYLILLFYPS